MKVSIVIPVYNREKVLPRTLSSVASQSFRPLEVILVDNGSSDASPNVMEAFAREHDGEDGLTVVTMNESKRGACAARNTGAHAATGDFLLFFDSDDTMEPDHVERTTNAVERADGNVDIVAWGRRLHDMAGNVVEKRQHRRDIVVNHLLHSTLSTQSYAVRSEYFVNAAPAGWDESLPAWNDYELGLRLLLARPRLITLNDKITVDVYSSGAESITGTGFADRHGYWESVLDMMEREIKAASRDDEARLLRVIDYRRLTLAALYEGEGCLGLAEPLREQAMRSFDRRLLARLVMPHLFTRIARGRRGSARIARFIL